jgi:uncharacterized membrane protein
MSSGVFTLTLVTAVGCGLVGGVFFAFSTFAMRGLTRLPPAQGMAAMQSINVTAVSPLFMTALFGTGAAAVAVGVVAVASWDEDHAVYLLVASLLYLVGTIVMTIAYHVPRNDALAAVDPADPGAARHWARYHSTWTAGNHVRTLTSLAACALLIGGIHAA